MAAGDGNLQRPIRTNAMTHKRKSDRNSRKNSNANLRATVISNRAASKPSSEFRRLSPSELHKLGLSKKSERYVYKHTKRLTVRTPTISKRQVQQKRLSEQAGRRVTLEKRAREYLTGERQAATASEASMRERAIEAWRLRRRYKSETVPRIRKHLAKYGIESPRRIPRSRGVFPGEGVCRSHIEVPEERAFYQKWFNYGHVKRAGSSNGGRTK